MPTCRYHPLEPADRVCAPCLASKLNSLSRKEGGIRRLVDSFHAPYPEEEDLPIFSLYGFGSELEKKAPGGGTISTLLRSESQRESSGSANAFFSCASEISNRLSADTHSDVDVKSATPSRKSDSRRFKVELLPSNFGDLGGGNESSSNPSAVIVSHPAVAPLPYSVQTAHFPPANVETLASHQHQHQQHHQYHLGAFSDRLCISDLITQSMRETDAKYRKPCNFSSQNLPKRTELKDPSHSHGICLKTPIWKFKLFSKSSPIWRLGLKGSKVSPSKREVDIETRGAGAGGSHKETTRHNSNTRRLIASSPPDDSVRLWCPSPMVPFKDGSFRWGKSFDKGSGSCRKTGRDEEVDTMQADGEHQQQPSSSSSTNTTTGVFRRLFDLTHRRGGNSANRSETESTSSWNNNNNINNSTALRTEEILTRTQYDEEQAQLAANILSWMDGAAATAVLHQQHEVLEELPSTCSTMAGITGEMPRFPEPELAVR